MLGSKGKGSSGVRERQVRSAVERVGRRREVGFWPISVSSSRPDDANWCTGRRRRAAVSPVGSVRTSWPQSDARVRTRCDGPRDARVGAMVARGSRGTGVLASCACDRASGPSPHEGVRTRDAAGELRSSAARESRPRWSELVAAARRAIIGSRARRTITRTGCVRRSPRAQSSRSSRQPMKPHPPPSSLTASISSLGPSRSGK